MQNSIKKKYKLNKPYLIPLPISYTVPIDRDTGETEESIGF